MISNKLLSQKITGKTNRATIDVKHLSQGVYTYKCVGSQSHTYAAKIVIE